MNKTGSFKIDEERGRNAKKNGFVVSNTKIIIVFLIIGIVFTGSILLTYYLKPNGKETETIYQTVVVTPIKETTPLTDKEIENLFENFPTSGKLYFSNRVCLAERLNQRSSFLARPI